jgi:hypothetical protein
MNRTWLLIALIAGLLIGGTQPLLLGQSTSAEQIAGTYVMAEQPSNRLVLHKDGSLYLVQNGKSNLGTFTIEGDKLTLRVGKPVVRSTGVLQGDTMVDPDGSKWVKQTVAPRPARTAPAGDTVAQRPSGGQQAVSLEQGLSSQYPNQSVLNVLQGVAATGGCDVHPQSTFKVADGKMHGPSFLQNAALAGFNCSVQTIAPGTQVSIASMKINQKSNRVSFVVVQDAISSQVDFEYSKGFLATAQLAQVQEVIGKVFSIANPPDAPAEEAEVAPEPVAPPPPPVAPLNLPSSYVSAQAPADKLQLSADNSFSLQEGGVSYRGTFVANGGTLELTFSDGATKATLSRQGSDLTGSDGQTWSWREQSAEAAPNVKMLRNEDVIKLVKVGVADSIIIKKISSSQCQFDTSTDALIQLKKSGVRPAVLKVMMGSGK